MVMVTGKVKGMRLCEEVEWGQWRVTIFHITLALVNV